MAPWYTLLYVLQFGDDHSKEIEDLWAALVACWPGNLKVIIRYIIIISGMAPNTLLPYVSVPLFKWPSVVSVPVKLLQNIIFFHFWNITFLVVFIILTYFKSFLEDISPFLYDHRYPSFEFLVTSVLGFKVYFCISDQESNCLSGQS